MYVVHIIIKQCGTFGDGKTQKNIYGIAVQWTSGSLSNRPRKEKPKKKTARVIINLL